MTDRNMKSSSPLVSVIVASYNYETYIQETLDSLAAQTYKNIEVIVVDDGSKDNSVQVIEGYCKKYGNIFLYRHPDNQNRGLAETVRLGISKSKGEWIAFCESDDYFTTDHIEKKIQFAQEKNADFIVNNVKVVGWGSENKNEYLDNAFSILERNNGKNIFHEVAKENIIPTFSGVMLKKEAISSCDFRPYIAPWLDYWLWFQITFNHAVHYMPEKLTFWRKHQQSYLSTSFHEEQRIDFAKKVKSLIWEKNIHKLSPFSPAFKKGFPVLMASDETYASYLGVAIGSLIENASVRKNYDILILDDGLSEEKRWKLNALAVNKDNISLRFFDVRKWALLKESPFYEKSAFLPWFSFILFEDLQKVLYLDADVIISSDLSELYKNEMKENVLAGVPDVLEYGQGTIDAGVLLFNIEEPKKKVLELFSFLDSVTKPISREAVINRLCGDKISFLENKWNFIWNLPLSENLPEIYETEYPSWNIMHLRGEIKPWRFPQAKRAEIWWDAARRTPFYEEILFENITRSFDVSDFARHSFVKEVAAYGKNKKALRRYKVLSWLTYGKKRRKYKRKAIELEQKIKELERMF